MADLRDTIYEVIQETMQGSDYGGFVGAGDVQRIEQMVEGFPPDSDYEEEQLAWLTGALAAVAMVAPYAAQDGAQRIYEAMTDEAEFRQADDSIGGGITS